MVGDGGGGGVVVVMAAAVVATAAVATAAAAAVAAKRPGLAERMAAVAWRLDEEDAIILAVDIVTIAIVGVVVRATSASPASVPGAAKKQFQLTPAYEDSGQSAGGTRMRQPQPSRTPASQASGLQMRCCARAVERRRRRSVEARVKCRVDGTGM